MIYAPDTPICVGMRMKLLYTTQVNQGHVCRLISPKPNQTRSSADADKPARRV